MINVKALLKINYVLIPHTQVADLNHAITNIYIYEVSLKQYMI